MNRLKYSSYWFHQRGRVGSLVIRQSSKNLAASYAPTQSTSSAVKPVRLGDEWSHVDHQLKSIKKAKSMAFNKNEARFKNQSYVQMPGIGLKSAITKKEFQSPKRMLESRKSSELDHPFLKKIGVFNNRKISLENSANKNFVERRSPERLLRSHISLKDTQAKYAL